MITLTDTFNGTVISRHRTVKAAEVARRRHAGMVRKANGANSYVTYSIRADDGRDISEELETARHILNCLQGL